MDYPAYKCPHCNGEVYAFGSITRYNPDYGDETYDICPLCCEETHMVRMKLCPICKAGWMLPGEQLCDGCKRYWRDHFKARFQEVPQVVRDYIDDELDGRSIEEFCNATD